MVAPRATAVAEAFGRSALSVTVMDRSRARVTIMSRYCSITALAASSAGCTTASRFSAGDMPVSPRMLRTPETTSIRRPIRALGLGIRRDGGCRGGLSREGGPHDGAVGAGQLVPDLLGHEGDERVQQDEGVVQHPPQDGERLLPRVRGEFAVQGGLDQLQVPVAELVPEKSGRAAAAASLKR